jgi:hypothetical protein
MERSAVAHQPQDRVPERDSLGLTVVSLALLQTAVLVLEDDMSISPVYATYLELVMGMVSNTSFVVGASLSPIRMAEMVTPAKRWEGSEKLADSRMYLSAVPSGVPPAPRNAGSLR